MTLFDYIGARLKEEREALGKSQTDLAKAIEAAGAKGSTRQSQSKYEKGERLPDAGYLAVAMQMGIDVQYVLTGRRAPSRQAPDAVTAGCAQASANASAPTHLPVGGAAQSSNVPTPALLMEPPGLYGSGGATPVAAFAAPPMTAQPALPHDARRLAEAFAALPERTPQEADSRYQLYIDIMAIITARCAATATAPAPRPQPGPTPGRARRTRTPP